jgi:hypothetical protein
MTRKLPNQGRESIRSPAPLRVELGKQLKVDAYRCFLSPTDQLLLLGFFSVLKVFTLFLLILVLVA